MSGIRMKTKDVVVCGLLASMLLVTQVALSFLPNIEVVSLLVLVYTLVLGRKTLDYYLCICTIRRDFLWIWHLVDYVFICMDNLIYGCPLDEKK